MLYQSIQRKIFIISAIVITITIIHYTVPHSLIYIHDISRRLYYLPIIIAAFWFGKRGGIVSAASVTLLYFPHALFSWYGKNPRYLDNMIEIIFFNVVGYLVGTYIEKKNEQRIQAEQKARELNEAYTKLQNNTEKIVQLEEKLRFADRLSFLGELSASLAHEIRNPLGGIQGAAEILRNRIPKTEKENEFIEIQLNEIQRLNKVVENFLALSKGDKKEFKKLNLIDILQGTINLIRISAKNNNVNINTSFPENKIVNISCDPVQIQQVIVNISLNGIHAMPEGGELTFSLKIPDDSTDVTIGIADMGFGIKEEYKDEIYKAFFTTEPDGTGLGLSISKRIVQDHSGKIWFETSEKGTCFYISIPIV